MHANVALDISGEARADRGQWLLDWVNGGGWGEGKVTVGAKAGTAAWFWSCEPGGLGQRGEIEKRMEKDGEENREGERECEA